MCFLSYLVRPIFEILGVRNDPDEEFTDRECVFDGRFQNNVTLDIDAQNVLGQEFERTIRVVRGIDRATGDGCEIEGAVMQDSDDRELLVDTVSKDQSSRIDVLEHIVADLIPRRDNVVDDDCPVQEINEHGADELSVPFDGLTVQDDGERFLGEFRAELRRCTLVHFVGHLVLRLCHSVEGVAAAHKSLEGFILFVVGNFAPEMTALWNLVGLFFQRGVEAVFGADVGCRRLWRSWRRDSRDGVGIRPNN